MAGLLGGCSTSVKGQRIDFVLGYAPDGEHVLVDSRAGTLRFVNLGNQRVVWERPYEGAAQSPASYARFSANGDYFLLVQQQFRTTPARYSVWRGAAGDLAGPAVEVPAITAAHDPWRVDVSADGRFIASALEGQGLRIHEQPSRQLVFTGPREPVATVAFSAVSPRLAARLGRDSRGRVLVLRQEQGRWLEAASVADGRDFAWAGGQLVVVTGRGLQIWGDGGTRDVALPPPAPVAVFPLPPAPNLVLAASDGRIDLVDVARNASVLTKTGLGAVWGAELRDGVLVLGVEREDSACFISVIDLRDGRVRKETSLGQSWVTSRFGVPWAAKQQFVFAPALLPRGKYVDLHSEDIHRFSPVAE